MEQVSNLKTRASGAEKWSGPTHHGTLTQAGPDLALRQIRQGDNLLPAGLCTRLITGSGAAVSMAEPQLQSLSKRRTEIQVYKAGKPLNGHF